MNKPSGKVAHEITSRSLRANGSLDIPNLLPGKYSGLVASHRNEPEHLWDERGFWEFRLIKPRAPAIVGHFLSP